MTVDLQLQNGPSEHDIPLLISLYFEDKKYVENGQEILLLVRSYFEQFCNNFVYSLLMNLFTNIIICTSVLVKS